MSLPAARERVRVARALGALPRLCEAMESGRVSYSKARAITCLATPHNEELLVGYAQSATAAQLEKVLRGYRQVSRLEDARDAAMTFERRWVRHWVDEDGCVRIAAWLPPDEGAVVVAQLDRLAESGGEDGAALPAPEETRVSAETARRLACDASITALLEDAEGKPLGVGRQSAKVPRRIRRALMRRDRGGCRFPGCAATRFVDAHHIEHWADGGPTDLDNLILLCRFHHRLVHEVGYSILVEDDATFRFRRPDGTPVPDQPPSRPGDPTTVERDNADRDLSIDWLTSVPDWDGTPPDYSAAVEHLYLVSAETPNPSG